ncbi:hypothetical protein [Asaia astilbis]|uniref:hypothetical protein n=1 Tax=Asaia astilbis TaxID=610244 RepID=UPI0012EC247F|nr:hypothetical protein [Asaia astilbis]
MSLTVLVGAMIFSYAFVRGANSFVKGGCKLERGLLFEGMRDRLGDASFFGFVFGISLAISGWPGFAALSTVVFTAALVAASNAKHILLQEPLVFTDFVLLKCVVKHPTFYMFAIGIRLRLAIVLGLILMIGLLVWSLVSAPLIGHVTGLFLIIFFLTVLRLLPVEKIAPEPDLARDVSRLGLGGCLALYWRRWLQQAPGPVPALPSPAKAEPGEICIVVQCESFAEPARLGLPSSVVLPELNEFNAARARRLNTGGSMSVYLAPTRCALNMRSFLGAARVSLVFVVTIPSFQRSVTLTKPCPVS